MAANNPNPASTNPFRSAFAQSQSPTQASAPAFSIAGGVITPTSPRRPTGQTRTEPQPQQQSQPPIPNIPKPNPFIQHQTQAPTQIQPQLQSQPQSPSNPVDAEKERAKEQFRAAWTSPPPKQPIPDSPDAPLPPFRVGMSIDNDRIKLLDFVGQGSFAHVYLGYDYSTASKCAVKCLLKAGADPKKMTMQKREVHAMEDLSGHANVIKLIRTVESDEWLLIVMEFCQIDLYEAIMQKGGFPDFAVKDVFSQLCDGVMHCHSRGYYHRDLKPENILLDVGALTAKITDFGLATRDTWCYEMGCGSTRYIPPEACATADPTKGYSPIASDVWALGILLINLLFSKNPWFEATMADPIFSIYVTDRPDILRHHFKISVEFDAILGRVFNMDPAKRLPLPEFKKLINALPSFLEEDQNSENAVPPLPNSLQSVNGTQDQAFLTQQQHQDEQRQQQQQIQQQPEQQEQQQIPQKTFASSTSPAFASPHRNTNPFGSSKKQGPLVVFGSIPDTKYTQFNDPFNSTNSNSFVPVNITSSDYNPFSSENAILVNNSALRGDTPEELVNPFFTIPSDDIMAIPMPPSEQDTPVTADEFGSSPFIQIGTADGTAPILPAVVANPSLATLIWTAPSRVAAPDLPNTLTLGREGIGRIGISRLATAKQRLSNFRRVDGANFAAASVGAGASGLGPGAAGNIAGDLRHHYQYQQTRPTSTPFGLAFLGTAIKGYVNPDSGADEIFEGDDVFDSEDLDDDEIAGAGGNGGGGGGGGGGIGDVSRSAPDEESHYEVVKVDRRLIPDLEKGIKRAVNRGMKKFRPFMKSEDSGGTGNLVDYNSNHHHHHHHHGVPAGATNLKLGKGVAGSVSTNDWYEFANTGAGIGDTDEAVMPGAFVFAKDERRKSIPMPLNDEIQNFAAVDLPLYGKANSNKSSLRPGKSGEDLQWTMINDGTPSSEDELKTSRGRRKNNGETVLAKMYNGLAGMNILGGSRSKSLKRSGGLEQKSSRNSVDSLPLRLQPDQPSILPPPQAPFAFIVAKNAKSRATEQDFEDLVVNAKTSTGNTTTASLPRHRHRVKNNQSSDESKIESEDNLLVYNHQALKAGIPSSKFSTDKISPSRRSMTQVRVETSPNRLSSNNRPQSEIVIGSTVPQEVTSPENPFKPLATASNPFQRQQKQPIQTRPSSMFQTGSVNPFQQIDVPQQSSIQPRPYSTIPFQAIYMPPPQLQQQQQQQQQQTQISLHPESTASFINLSPRMQFHQQQPLQQQQYTQQQPLQHQQQHPHNHPHSLHAPPSLPNLNFSPNQFPGPSHHTIAPFTDTTGGLGIGANGNNMYDHRTHHVLHPAEDDEDSGGTTGTHGGVADELSAGSDDDGAAVISKRGEDRYVRGLVRGFGWLVGSGHNNMVDRSDSHGV